MKPQLRPPIVATLALLAIAAGCGGGGGSSPSPSPTPSPGSPPSSSADPCAAALQASDVEFELQALDDPRPRPKSSHPLGGDARSVDDLLWEHWSRPDVVRGTTDEARLGPARTEDIGEIAVIEDDGTLLTQANTFDLKSTGLRFRRSPSGGFDVARIDAAFRTPLGNRLNLGDDDTSRVDVASGVSFLGRSYTSLFVNSDGNITFDRGDSASTSRSVGRVVAGPPRVAPFFADLDPSTGNGRVFAHVGSEGVTVTWCSVRGFDKPETVTTQATILSDGTVEMRYGATIDLTSAVVAVAQGGGDPFTRVDLSAGGLGGNTSGEQFAARGELDEVALARRFYESHADTFDQLVIWGETDLVGEDGGFAFEVTVQNAIRGIGVSQFNASREFGSSRLQSIVNMDRLAKYPADPRARVLGANSTVSVMGQEVGHRWLAFLQFRNTNGQPSNLLLGRDGSHWSFFFDSDASVMEGNDIEELGGGSFRTAAAVERYSLLDQYAMGLIPPSDVPRVFYVEAPVNVSPPAESDSSPRVGVTFSGTRRDVLIEDIVAVMGAREPSSATSTRTFRQAYVFVIGRGRTASADDVAKVDRIRREFTSFFAQATSGRMTLQTTLR